MGAKNRLEPVVYSILEENSGGIKYIDLLLRILTKHLNGEGIIEFSTADDHKIGELLLEKLRKMEGIGVLEYIFKGLNRTKYFIYEK